MVRNPYQKVALSSTWRTIAFIFGVILVILGGLFLGKKDGFDVRLDISGKNNYSGYEETGRESGSKVLFTINLVYALGVILAAILIIVIRRDIVGVISGIILMLFVFFVLSVGEFGYVSSASGNHSERLTLFTMLTDTVKTSEN